MRPEPEDHSNLLSLLNEHSHQPPPASSYAKLAVKGNGFNILKDEMGPHPIFASGSRMGTVRSFAFNRLTSAPHDFSAHSPHEHEQKPSGSLSAVPANIKYIYVIS